MPKHHTNSDYTYVVKPPRRFRFYWISIGLLIIGLLIQSIGLQTPAQAQILTHAEAVSYSGLSTSRTVSYHAPLPPPAPQGQQTGPNANAIPAWQSDQTHPHTIADVLQSRPTVTSSKPVNLLAATPTYGSANVSSGKAVRPNLIINPSQTIYANQLTDDAANHAPPADCYLSANNTDCSLRSAVKVASADSNRSAAHPDLILLQPQTVGTYNITSTVLPQLPDNVYLSTNSMLNCTSANSIAIISGQHLSGNADGLTLGSGDYLVNVAVGYFSNNGITVSGSNNVLTCVVVSNNLSFGIYLGPGASNNQIGGQLGNGSDSSSATAGGKIFGYGGAEVVSGFNGLGIGIRGSATMSTTNNIIRNTDVGYVPNFFAGGNTDTGIFIYQGATNNIIGSTLVTQTNIISQNTYDGIGIRDPTTSGNQLIGNLIGTSITGTIAAGNKHDGIDIQGGASNTVVQGNVISGNGFSGVAISGSSNNTIIQGNIIGVKKDLSAVLLNGTSGNGNNGTGETVCNPGGGNTPDKLSEDCNAIFVYGSPVNGVGSPTGTQIGGNANIGQGNVLATDSTKFFPNFGVSYPSGVLLDYTNGNTVQGNSIGAIISGTSAVNYGTSVGVWAIDGAANNQIGGDSSQGLGNFIGGNDYGVVVNATDYQFKGVPLGPSNGNKIQGNTIGVDFAGNPNSNLVNKFVGIALYDQQVTYTVNSNLVGIDYSAANPNPAQGNLVGNTTQGDGISLSTSGFPDSNQINGNKIGVNAALTASTAGNQYNGIYVSAHATNTKIQGNYVGAANLTANNYTYGLYIYGPITNTVITNNYIGTNAAGADFHNNTGIYLYLDYKTTVSQNVIGSNLSDGIFLDYASKASSISQNIIKNNGGVGINAYNYNGITPDNATVQNTFSQNSIYGNAKLGINLNYLPSNPQGINEGSDAGTNNQAQIPVINTAQIGLNSGLQVTGATSPNSNVEVFLADSTTITQGRTYLGTAAANGVGFYSLNMALPNGFVLNPPAVLVATDTLNDPTFPNRIGSTSQFSLPFTATVLPALALNPAALTFNAVAGTNPAGQATSLAVAKANATYTSSTAYSANSGNNGWLSLNPSSGTVTPGNNIPLSVNVNTAGLAAGTYTATVTFQDTAYTGDKATLNVTLVITASNTATPTPTNTAPTPTPTVPTATPTPTPPTNTPTATPTTTPPDTGGGNGSYTYNLPLLANNATTALGRTTTFITFQNLASNAGANITVKYYDINTGNPTAYQDNLNIVAHGQQAILPAILTGSSFGGVVTSNQPLNLVVSEGLNAGGSAYNVSAATASTLYSPLALNGQFGFNTDIVIFNAASGGTATGKIFFYDENGNPSGTTQTFQIAAHASQTFKQADAGSGLANNHAYWAKIVADNSSATLSAQVIEFGPNNFVATFNALVATQLSNTIYAPATFDGKFGFVTGMALANPNSNLATGTITYYDATGANLGQATLNIPGNGVVGIFQGNANAPSNTTSAVINSNQPLIATVNERGPGNVSGTYVGLANGNTSVALPVMANGFAGFITGATVLNTSSQTAHLTFQYLKQDGTSIGTTQSATLAPNASFLVYQGDPAQGLPGPSSSQPFFGTALLNSDQPLLVTTNALNTSNGLFYTYTEPSN